MAINLSLSPHPCCCIAELQILHLLKVGWHMWLALTNGAIANVTPAEVCKVPVHWAGSLVLGIPAATAIWGSPEAPVGWWHMHDPAASVTPADNQSALEVEMPSERELVTGAWLSLAESCKRTAQLSFIPGTVHRIVRETKGGWLKPLNFGAGLLYSKSQLIYFNSWLLAFKINHRDLKIITIGFVMKFLKS